MSHKKKTNKKVITPTEKKDNKVVFENGTSRPNVGKIVLLSLVGAAIVATIVTTIVLLGKNNPKPGPTPTGDTVKFSFKGINCFAEHIADSEWSKDINKGEPYTILVRPVTDYFFSDPLKPGEIVVEHSESAGDIEYGYTMEQGQELKICFKNPTGDFKVTVSPTKKTEYTLSFGSINERWGIYKKDDTGTFREISEIGYKEGDNVSFLFCAKQEGVWSEPKKENAIFDGLTEAQFDFGETEKNYGHITFEAPGKSLVFTSAGEPDRIGYAIHVYPLQCTSQNASFISMTSANSTIRVEANRGCRTPNKDFDDISKYIKVDGANFDYKRSDVSSEETKVCYITIANVTKDVTVDVTCPMTHPF